MPTLSLLVTPSVVVRTTCDPTSGEKVGIVTTLGFQCFGINCRVPTLDDSVLEYPETKCILGGRATVVLLGLWDDIVLSVCWIKSGDLHYTDM